MLGLKQEFPVSPMLLSLNSAKSLWWLMINSYHFVFWVYVRDRLLKKCPSFTSKCLWIRQKMPCPFYLQSRIVERLSEEGERSGIGASRLLFLKMFSVSKFSADGILQTYGCICPCCHKMTVTSTVCIALHFFATGTYMHSVSDAENQNTACHNIKGKRKSLVME